MSTLRTICDICGHAYTVRLHPTEDVCPDCLCGTDEGIRISAKAAADRLLARHRNKSR